MTNAAGKTMTTVDTGSEVADGVHRCGSERVNWYLVEEADALTVVDTGFPSHWQQLLDRQRRAR